MAGNQQVWLMKPTGDEEFFLEVWGVGGVAGLVKHLCQALVTHWWTRRQCVTCVAVLGDK